jgi:NAD(P)-dependent dehydrogenase (short-subunit alcohol dehydrogenase family)
MRPTCSAWSAVPQAMLPLLRRSAAARVVNMSSKQGSLALAADPEAFGSRPCLLAYNSSKAALNAITIAYANQLRRPPLWPRTDRPVPQ